MNLVISQLAIAVARTSKMSLKPKGGVCEVSTCKEGNLLGN